MKKLNTILGKLEASINGFQDGIEWFSNDSDVIGKSDVLKMLSSLLKLTNEAQQEVNKNLHKPAVVGSGQLICRQSGFKCKFGCNGECEGKYFR